MLSVTKNICHTQDNNISPVKIEIQNYIINKNI